MAGKIFGKLVANDSAYTSRFTNKFYTAAKNGGKMIFFFCKMWHMKPQVKNFVKITLPRTISKINGFFALMQKFKMATKNGRKTVFGKKWQMT